MLSQSPANLEHEPYEPSIFRGRNTSSQLDARQAAAFSARSKKIAARVAAAMAKAEARDRQMVEKQAKLLAKQTAKGRRRFEAETEARERKRRREIADKAKKKGKVREKTQEREAREEHKRLDKQKSWKEADEKKWKRHLEGVAWGFDDRAGVRCGTSSEQPAGPYVRKGSEQHGEETDADHSEGDEEIAKRARRLRHDGSTWGIEAGGPGPEVMFEFGVPIPVKVAKRIGGWKRRNNE